MRTIRNTFSQKQHPQMRNAQLRPAREADARKTTAQKGAGDRSLFTAKAGPKQPVRCTKIASQRLVVIGNFKEVVDPRELHKFIFINGL
ncbi:hypothetical protein [Acetobacter sp. KSO5]|uniref:hypothetical protein n=1 Tax=Acetobacter sp. KSO5 TaxID=3373674 RepID=UPI00376F0642